MGRGRRATTCQTPAALRGASKAAHLISAADAERWLAGSLFPEPLWHCTTPGAAEAILAEGPHMKPSVYGTGLWLSTNPEYATDSNKPTRLQVAARILHPVPDDGETDGGIARVTTYRQRVDNEVGDELVPASRQARADRQAEMVLADGYQAVTMNMGQDTWVFVYDATCLRVVEA
jgi:hypothetical protein